MRWVGHTGGLEPGATQSAGIADTAGTPRRIRLITRHRQAVIEAQRSAAPDDLSLAQFNNGRMYGEARTFHRRFRSQIRHMFKSADEFTTTIWVA